MNIDLTPVAEAIIAIFAALVTYKLLPYIKSKTSESQLKYLESAAKIAVYAAEQLFEYGDNAKKLDYAKTQLLNLGLSVNIDTIRSAIEKAVYEMKVTNQTSETDDTTATSDESTNS